MSNINRVKLTNACDIIMGQSPESSTYNQEGKGLPFFQGKADFGVLHPSIRYYCSDPKKVAQADDILLSVRAPIGALNIATEESCIGRGLAALRVKNSTDTMYLYYLLQSLNGVLNARGTGSTFKAISKQDLDEIYIPLPDILRQKRIAATLDTVSEVLRLRKAQLAELDNLVKAKFVEMFGDPVTNPYSWTYVNIASFTEVMTGATPRRSNLCYYDGDVPWVKTGEIKSAYIYDASETITQKAVRETNCKVFPKDTIMIAMYGQGKTRGQSGILKIEAATNQACAAILPNDSYNTVFLYMYLHIQYNQLRCMGRGAQQSNLNLSMICSFPVFCVPLERQKQYAAFFETVDQLKQSIQQSLDETQRLFDSLMAEYFEE